MTARIAKNGDRIRLLGDEYESCVNEVVTVRVSSEHNSFAVVVPSDGEEYLIYRDVAEEMSSGKWEFVDEISSEELATAIGLNFEGKVDAALADVKAKLIAKNNQYGNSALEPIRAFSKLNPVEQLLIRIDDKISRLQKGDGTGDEDAEADTLGYLILLAIARKDANA